MTGNDADQKLIDMKKIAHLKILMISIAILYLGLSIFKATDPQFDWLGKNKKLETLAAAKIEEGVYLSLEIAETPQAKAKGLMHRESLGDHEGMLFLFEPPQKVSFWMKNVTQPLDIIFLLNGKVMAIAPNTPPCQADPCPLYPSGVAVNQVIELKAGSTARFNLKPGDCIELMRSPHLRLDTCKQ